GGGSAASSSSGDNDVLYGNASDSEDGDYIVDENGNTVLSPKPGIGGGTGGGGSQGKPSEDHHIDPDAKKAFLASVPKGLSGQTVKVLVWWAPGVAETAKAAEFEAATGIKIKFIQCNVDGSFQKLAAMIGQGNAPDLACIEQSNFPAIVMQDYFQPLSVGKLDLSDKIYDKETMDKFKWDGQYYGAMIKSSTMVTFYNMFYNADMFSRYGIKTPYDHWQGGTWDWDQLVATSLELKKNGVKAPLISDYHANCFIPSAGTDPVKFEGNKIINNCNDDKLLKAWQFLNDMKTKHKILNTDLNYQFFFSGESAMLMTGNYIMQRGDEIDKNVKFKWGFA
ncbi:MAG: extracellular solute-binding protein, partial [Oscillospiraceae bacterium]